MRMCVCVCIDTHTQAPTHTHIHAPIYIYTYVCVLFKHTQTYRQVYKYEKINVSKRDCATICIRKGKVRYKSTIFFVEDNGTPLSLPLVLRKEKAIVVFRMCEAQKDRVVLFFLYYRRNC